MAKTIVMIHGMWGGGWYWDKFQGYFENKGYRCIAPYLRHHDIQPDDPPPAGLGETSLLDYAGDLESEIKTLGEKPIIMGHSMGGLLAQILASRGLAQAAVLITPASPAGIFAITGSVLKSFSEVLFRWGFWKNPHKLSYEKAVFAMMEKLPEEERRYIYHRGVWESGRAATEIGFWAAGVKGAEVAAASVTCPVLVIAGAEDRITPAKVVKRVAQRYAPSYTYVEIGGHAHWIIREPGWEKVAACIHRWLEEHVT
ncbi:MAG: alpha/beta hydrolase [Thermodesulfobacteriota bacterium]